MNKAKSESPTLLSTFMKDLLKGAEKQQSVVNIVVDNPTSIVQSVAPPLLQQHDYNHHHHHHHQDVVPLVSSRSKLVGKRMVSLERYHRRSSIKCAVEDHDPTPRGRRKGRRKITDSTSNIRRTESDPIILRRASVMHRITSSDSVTHPPRKPIRRPSYEVLGTSLPIARPTEFDSPQPLEMAT